MPFLGTFSTICHTCGGLLSGKKLLTISKLLNLPKQIDFVAFSYSNQSVLTFVAGRHESESRSADHHAAGLGARLRHREQDGTCFFWRANTGGKYFVNISAQSVWYHRLTSVVPLVPGRLLLRAGQERAEIELSRRRDHQVADDGAHDREHLRVNRTVFFYSLFSFYIKTVLNCRGAFREPYTTRPTRFRYIVTHNIMLSFKRV